jgi:hypothetical protein
MSFYKYIILLLVPLFSVAGLKAQDTDYVYRDTSIVSPDTTINSDEINGVEYDEEDENSIIYQDTALRQNQFVLNKDSVESLKRLKAFAYAKNLDSLLYQYQKAQKEKQVPTRNERSWLEVFFMASATQYFFWILGGLFIVFILYKLFFTQGFFLRAYAKATVSEIADEPPGLSATMDFTKLIAQAVSLKDYRLAIRYYYLQVLQKLSSKGAIEFAPDKTNHEYLAELNGKPYKKDFAALTRHYEYAWYGEFEIGEQVFSAIQQKFKQLNSVL